MQVAFDIFDANQDEKITELDLFKTTYMFNKGNNKSEFETIFYQDICQITKELTKSSNKKFE